MHAEASATAPNWSSNTMTRFRFASAGLLIAVIAVSACSANTTSARTSPPAPPAGPSAAPSAAPSPTPVPSVPPPPATPAPTQQPDVATPRPTAQGFSDDEQHLLDGVQRGTENCRPARGDKLPDGAVAGIECDSAGPAVARIGFYVFADDQTMVDAYLARMQAEGVKVESGTCNDGESEHAYVPDEEFAQDRAGCFLNDEGFANYRYTITGNHVYVGILGRSADMAALESFAWKGNQDTPGMPTLWFGGID
jgi:catechol 2,3-dioxygenase-like lactoylglutathione lyase family enzyme